LGNQLFQFAAGLSYALKNDSKIRFESNELERDFELKFLSIEPQKIYIPQVLDDYLVLTPCEEKDKCEFKTFFEESFLHQALPTLPNHVELRGYFQSEKYFHEISPILREFMREKLRPEFLDDSINLHIRLGDYYYNEATKRIHGVMSQSYFLAALGELNSPNSKISLHTDSPELINPLYPKLSEIANICRLSPFETFRRLSGSKYLIISNSTFGWWAGWISGGTVIAPSNWFDSTNESGLSGRDLKVKGWKWI
jgi:hypothetical protein